MAAGRYFEATIESAEPIRLLPNANQPALSTIKISSGTSMSSASSSSDEDSSDSDVIETLVEGRAKRATAANRYNRDQIVAEETQDPEDEIALLFEEQEVGEDEEFEESVDEEENLSSSDDDDDQGPNAAADDLDGEQALQREEKAKRNLKRKATLALTTTAGLRKKVRIDPRVPSRMSAPKPTKKKERTFLVNENEVVRTSKRAQTQANSETVKARLVEDEKLRLKHKAKRDKLNRQKELEKEDEMTQEERLAEAAKIERRNAKSYNRWEAKEKERADEQAAKLAAMRNRKLDGPVIGYWSGVARWTGPRSTVEEAMDVSNEVARVLKKRGRKSKIELEEMAAKQRLDEKNATSHSFAQGLQPESQTSMPVQPQPPRQHEIQGNVLPTVVSDVSTSNEMLGGIRDYASEHKNPPQLSTPREAIETTDMEVEAADSPQVPAEEQTNDLMGDDDQSGPAQKKEVDAPVPPPAAETPITEIDAQDESVKAPEENEIATPPVIELATRNLVGLGNFDELSSKDRSRYSVFFNKRANKIPKNPKMQASELCLITGQVARYRDPSTGIVYANSFAYRKIQQLRRHEHVWSSMLGCYVGRVGQVARGVPSGFLG